jgi:glycosyltransferase involved in cell wall biosynthesis
MTMRALYLSHTGMTEPLARSQVLPYVAGLARAGWRIDIVGFEPAAAPLDEIEGLSDQLARAGIRYTWGRRSAAHDPLTKLREGALTLARAAARATTGRPRIVHARSYLAAAAAHLLTAALPGARFIFDCRGLLGDEYVDIGHWSRHSARYRVLKHAERRLFARADAVVTLTDRLRRWLRERNMVGDRAPIEVIPCCVDLQQFRASPADRAWARTRMGAGDRLVVAYSGSLGPWYCEEEMAQLFARVRQARPALFCVLTRADATPLRAALRAAGVPDADVLVTASPPTEVSRWLAGADAALALVRPCFSKIASSPVKVGEYLAMGLPVVVNRGIGDQDALIEQCPAIVDAGHLDTPSLARAADALAVRVDDPQLHRAARRVAEEQLCLERVGVARYARLYERLAG